MSEVSGNTGVVGVITNGNVERIIAAQRAGCNQIAMRPLDPNDLVLALRRILNVTEVPVEESTVVAIFGAMGGVGATTIACHQGLELGALCGKPSALFDLDFEFGGVARAMDIEAQFTIADLATAGAVDRFLLEKAAVAVSSSLHVFARPAMLEDAHTIAETDVRTMLRGARQAYRYVVADLSRQLSPVTGVAMEECDKLLIVIQLTVPNVDNAKRLTAALVADGIPPERIEFVVNRYRKNTHNCTVAMAEHELGKSVLALVPNDYQEVNAATDSGHLLSSRSRVRAAIRELAGHLTGTEEQDSGTQQSSWLHKLTSLRAKAAAEP